MYKAEAKSFWTFWIPNRPRKQHQIIENVGEWEVGEAYPRSLSLPEMQRHKFHTCKCPLHFSVTCTLYFMHYQSLQSILHWLMMKSTHFCCPLPNCMAIKLFCSQNSPNWHKIGTKVYTSIYIKFWIGTMWTSVLYYYLHTLWKSPS